MFFFIYCKGGNSFYIGKIFTFITVYTFDGCQTVTNVKTVTNVNSLLLKMLNACFLRTNLSPLVVRITDSYAIRIGAYHNLCTIRRPNLPEIREIWKRSQLWKPAVPTVKCLNFLLNHAELLVILEVRMTDSSAICIGTYHNLFSIRCLYLHEIGLVRLYRGSGMLTKY